MNKVKMFFIAAALVLTTAGVFAGKVSSKFVTYTLYAYNSTTGLAYELPTGSGLGASLTVQSSGTPLSFTSTHSNTYGLYAYDGTAGTYKSFTTSF